MLSQKGTLETPDSFLKLGKTKKRPPGIDQRAHIMIKRRDERNDLKYMAEVSCQRVFPSSSFIFLVYWT